MRNLDVIDPRIIEAGLSGNDELLRKLMNGQAGNFDPESWWKTHEKHPQFKWEEEQTLDI